MTRQFWSGFALAATAALAARRFAAPAKAPASSAQQDNGDDEPSVSELVVTGKRLPGAVVGDIKPEIRLSPADIRSYGVSTVTELLEELAPRRAAIAGGAGRRRWFSSTAIASPASRRSRTIPTEAILRVDILPEEVALKYGYTANQRVVNIVLRRRFHAITAEAGVSDTTEGGGESPSGELDRFAFAATPGSTSISRPSTAPT